MKDMGEIEATVHFCEKSEKVRDEIFAKEAYEAYYKYQKGDSWKWGSPIWNHKDLCGWFKTRNYEKRYDS
jgi:hypothetical protein